MPEPLTPSPRTPSTPPPVPEEAPSLPSAGAGLAPFPPTDRWDDWTEFDPSAWPRRVPHRYTLVPTTCFNCESACGLLAYVDQESFAIRKLEGNPAHPGSRGRNCAKGPATLNQIDDPERILYPLRRVGPRGGGKWERVSWDSALDDLAARIRQALQEDRRTEVMYHVGRPGEDGYMERVLQSWGIDGHNSHTNICSAGARMGYASWMGIDRPSPDYANARFILLVSAHLESGHYFNPHAQRIIEAKMRGAKVAVVDPRLSNSASMADYWLAAWPGSEAALLLGMAHVIIAEGLYDREFLRRWTNWDQYLRDERPDLEPRFETFEQELRHLYATFTPRYAEEESGVPAAVVAEVAREAARAGSALATHNWRAAAAGNLGGWQVARALFFLNVLTGSVGTPGGTSGNVWNKFVPRPFAEPGKQTVWNELSWPREYPLAHHEMSFLLPHFLKEGRGRLDVYFTRVYNPVWTNPDGFTWIEVLRDEKLIGLHAALTPVWSETAWLADYVLPMGVGAERHDLHSYETHAAQWLGFRQPVGRVARERRGQAVSFTYETNPGEVWEENEFWIELSWRIDPDGALGIRRLYESPYRPGEKVTIDEYYRWIFENSVPGLPEAAAAQGLTPLAYMRRYGAFEVATQVYRPYEQPLAPALEESASPDPASGVLYVRELPPAHDPNLVPRPAPGTGPLGTAVGVEVDGRAYQGFPTPSRKLEFYSPTLRDWGWPEYVIPGYTRGHVHQSSLDPERHEFALVPTFRLPVLVHTRSANAKWLNEIAHSNPVWIHTADARRLAVRTGDLVRVQTDIGHFVARAWVTEGIRPGVVACSHHLGRWRLQEQTGTDRWASALAELTEESPGNWFLRQKQGVRPFVSDDPDSQRVWWSDAGVHQNLAFPVHPDPVSGSHAWHQRVRVEKAAPTDRYGDIFVDTTRSAEIYREWLRLARPAAGPDGMRRPYWLLRPYRPAPAAYRLD